MENWRNDIEAIANKLAESLGGNWRNDLKVIREAVEAGSGGGGEGGASTAAQLDTQDTHGYIGPDDATVKLQPLIDAISYSVMHELVKIPTFQNHIAATSTDHDNRYDTKEQVNTKVATATIALNTHKTSGDHDSRYFQQGEDIDLANKYIWNVPEPISSDNAANMDYVDNSVQAARTSATSALNTHKSSGDHDARYLKAGVDVDMGSHKITSLATPTNANDAANKTYTDSRAGLVDTALTTHKSSGDHDARYHRKGEAIDMGSKAISNLLSPTTGTDACNRQYVDNAIASAKYIIDEHGFVDGEVNSEQDSAVMINKIATQTVFKSLHTVQFLHTGTVAAGATVWKDKNWTFDFDPIMWVTSCSGGLSISIDMLTDSGTSIAITNVTNAAIDDPWVACVVAEFTKPVSPLGG